MKKLYAIILATCFAMGAPVFAATDVAPDVLAKNVSQEVLTIVKQDKDIQAGDQKKILSLVEQKVLPHFDFQRMTMLAVGKHWNSATPQQQQQLISEFKNLLIRTYSSSLTAYKNQTIDFKPLQMQPADTDVVVRSQVNQPGGQPIPIDYSMEKMPNGWKVYDVAVDGVSLVTNYRSSFGTEIRQSGIDGLIKTLAQKNRQDGTSSANAPASPAKANTASKAGKTNKSN